MSNMYCQPELDDLWDLWAFDQNIGKENVDITLLSFRKYVRDQLKTFIPSRLDESVAMYIELSRFIFSKKRRPFSIDGSLGDWFNNEVQNNSLPNKFVRKWFSNFDFVREYKEFVLVFGREPGLMIQTDKKNEIGTKNGGFFASYELKLARWADEVRRCEREGKLILSRKRQIVDELGDDFSWDFVVDTRKDAGKKRVKR